MMILTGIKPTGTFHLGNYISTIKQIEELKNKDECYVFIADMHSLTKFQKPEELSQNIKNIYAVLMSFFHNDKNVKIYRQSKIRDIFKLYYILNCFCSKGLLNRNHTYKAAVEQNILKNKDADAGIDVGLFTYPTLMAADILIFNPDYVPVGIDQEQHMEITREIARRMNYTYNRDIFKIPESIHYKEETLLGTDGRKMSKSYNNIIPLFYDEKKHKKIVFSIATNSKNIGEPKFEGESAVTDIYRFISSEDNYKKLLLDMEKGIGWGEIKQRLLDAITELTKDKKELYYHFLNSNFDEKLLQSEAELDKKANMRIKEIESIIGVM